MESSSKAIEFSTLEQQPSRPADGSPVLAHGLDGDELPLSYYYSPRFLGTVIGICFSLAGSTGGFALIAPVLSQVNADIGPDKNIVWVALIFNIALGVGFALVGRLSDLFGRRWFFIGGTILGLVGNIVCATAKTVPILIGGMTITGLASCTGNSFNFVVTEIVPMKHRFKVAAVAILFIVPTSCIGPAYSNLFIYNTEAKWRWCFYVIIIWNGIALVLLSTCYFPPTFTEKHRNDRIITFVKNYDYIGTALYIIGIVLFLMGMSWGGNVYPWKSGRVIGLIIAGAFILVGFGLYEAYMPLKEPFVPTKLFRNRAWVATILVVGFCGGVYYSSALVWPLMSGVLYARPAEPMYAGWLACFSSLGFTNGMWLGCACSAPLSKYIKIKHQLIFAFAAGVVVLGCMATVNENTPTRGIVLIIMACFFIGYCDGPATIIACMEIENQDDIGAAGGISGAVRSIIGAVFSAMYTAVLTNRAAETIPAQVPKALVQAGLPASSVPAFLQAIAAGTAAAFEAVKGLTPTIQAVGVAAYKHAYSDAVRTVFLTSIACGGVGFLCTCLVGDVEKRMTNELSATLHGTAADKLEKPGAVVTHKEEA